MNKHIDTPKSNEFTGKHMLVIVIAFFAVIIGVNITMAVIASKTWTGLVVENSYVASQKFNAKLEAAARQEQRGWSGTIRYNAGVLEFTLVDKESRQVMFDDVVAHVGRPAFEQQDRQVKLLNSGNGTYQARLNFAPGPWQVSVRGRNDAGPYRLDTRIHVTATTSKQRSETP